MFLKTGIDEKQEGKENDEFEGKNGDDPMNKWLVAISMRCPH